MHFISHFSLNFAKADEKPDVTYQDIGGLDIQKQEIREAVELPLTNPELYAQIGTFFIKNSYFKLLLSIN